MPLIDEENNLLDVELMSDVASVFSTKNGLIIDDDWESMVSLEKLTDLILGGVFLRK